jgi:hypothetical protein
MVREDKNNRLFEKKGEVEITRAGCGALADELMMM